MSIWSLCNPTTTNGGMLVTLEIFTSFIKVPLLDLKGLSLCSKILCAHSKFCHRASVSGPSTPRRGVKLFLVSIGTHERSKMFVEVTGFPETNLFVVSKSLAHYRFLMRAPCCCSLPLIFKHPEVQRLFGGHKVSFACINIHGILNYTGFCFCCLMFVCHIAC